jgi:hypothetical protein
VKLAKFRKPKATHFLSFVEYDTNIHNVSTSNITYTSKCIQSVYPKVGLVEETKGGRKEGKKNSE